MDKLQVIYREIKTLHPYKNNAKKHPKEQIAQIAESIRQFGFVNPVLIDKDNNVVAGHGRCLAAKKIGMKVVPTIKKDNWSEDEVKAFRLIENKLNESEWDEELLNKELESLTNSSLNFEMEFFGFEKNNVLKDKPKYSMSMNVPQYEVKGEKPDVTELYDSQKTNELINEIKQSNIPEDIKRFLRLAAYRHTVFNYSKIAEYYCHASKNVQELMEKSALVIIDFDDAMKNGYTDLMTELIGMNEDDEQ